jgi:hypothetical protein
MLFKKEKVSNGGAQEANRKQSTMFALFTGMTARVEFDCEVKREG